MALGADVFGLICRNCALRFVMMTTAPENSNNTDRLDRRDSSRAATFINRCNQDDVPNVFEYLTANINNCEYFDINYKITNSNESDTLILLHANVRSLHKNFDLLYEFFLFLSSLQFTPHICITETRIRRHIFSNINLPSYSFVHADSKMNAGGVGI